jgi:hypothetical protein
MASPSFTKEYREWIAEGSFTRSYERARQRILEAIESRRPDLVASELESIAGCYYTRGSVALLDGNQDGWNEIQCGYLAAIYSIRFVIPLKSGLIARVKESQDNITQVVMTLGLSRLFGVQFDERMLRE